METEPLAMAAMAGSLAARGQHDLARDWEQRARQAMGHVMINWPSRKGATLCVRIIGGDRPHADDILALIEVLKIGLDGAERSAKASAEARVLDEPATGAAPMAEVLAATSPRQE